MEELLPCAAWNLEKKWMKAKEWQVSSWNVNRRLEVKLLARRLISLSRIKRNSEMVLYSDTRISFKWADIINELVKSLEKPLYDDDYVRNGNKNVWWKAVCLCSFFCYLLIMSTFLFPFLRDSSKGCSLFACGYICNWNKKTHCFFRKIYCSQVFLSVMKYSKLSV